MATVQPQNGRAQHFRALGKRGEGAKTLPEQLKWLRAAFSHPPLTYQGHENTAAGHFGCSGGHFEAAEQLIGGSQSEGQ